MNVGVKIRERESGRERENQNTAGTIPVLEYRVSSITDYNRDK